MLYRNYTKNEFKDLRKQHNIMVLVGNGFDIDILRNFGSNITTSYENFYNYIRYKKIDENNSIFKAMKHSKTINNQNWADFEKLLIELCDSKEPSWKKLDDDLFEIQKYFSNFLDDIIKPDLLASIVQKAQIEKSGVSTLSNLLYDISEDDYKDFNFPKDTWHYDLFNFTFINFNYTYLFDNYIYFDKRQFDPRPYKTVDRNFDFKPNPRGYQSNKHSYNSDTVISTYIVSKVIHPHGNQSIPKSLLFGFNDENQVKFSNTDKSKRFTKTFWAQNDLYYKNMVGEARLFVIFGLSCGETDKWWWHEIIVSLASTTSELIIYKYQEGNETSESVVDHFFKVSEVELEKEVEKSVKSKIYVVLHNHINERKLLKLNP